MASAVPGWTEESRDQATQRDQVAQRAPARGSILRAVATGGMLWVAVLVVLAVVSTQDWVAAFLAY